LFKEIFAKLLKEGLSPDQAAARAIQIIQSGKTEVASDEKMQVDQPRKSSFKCIKNTPVQKYTILFEVFSCSRF